MSARRYGPRTGWRELSQFRYRVQLRGKAIVGKLRPVVLFIADQLCEKCGISDQEIDNLLLVEDIGDLAGLFNAPANEIADHHDQFLSDLLRGLHGPINPGGY